MNAKEILDGWSFSLRRWHRRMTESLHGSGFCRRLPVPGLTYCGTGRRSRQLFATVGPNHVPGYILSGHMDVVPPGVELDIRSVHAEVRWRFALRPGDERHEGAFLAAALAALPAVVEMPLARPLHFAFSYDEEAGCRGVPHLIRQLPDLCAKPIGAIIGEPSGMRAIRAHKGKAAARVEIRGRSGHSSRPDQGLNAIHAFACVLLAAVRTGEALRSSRLDPSFEPPYSSLQVGTVSGGQAVNIIPDFLTAEIEARAITGATPADLLEPVRLAAVRLRSEALKQSGNLLSCYPAFARRRCATC